MEGKEPKEDVDTETAGQDGGTLERTTAEFQYWDFFLKEL